MPARTLGEALATLSPSELTSLLQHRDDLAHPLPDDLRDLVQRALTPTSVARVVDRLDTWQRAVALALAVAPDGTGVAELSELLGVGSATEVAAAVQDLRLRAMLWGTEDRLHLVRTVRESFGPFPAGLAPASAQPMEPDAVRAALEQIGTPEQTILDRLLWERPTGALQQADRALTLEGARNPIERLLALRLLRPVDAETVQLPREVAWALRGGRLTRTRSTPTAPVVSGRVRAETTVTRAGVGAAWALVHDVQQLVEDLDVREVTRLRDGGLASRDMTALGRRVELSPGQAGTLLEWAWAAGLVAGDGPRLLPTTRFDRWSSEDGGQRWLHLVRHWRAGSRWPPGSARPGAHPLGSEAELRGAPELRQGILSLLAALPVGQQTDAGQLAAVVGWHHPAWAERLGLEGLVGELLTEAEQAGLTALGAVSPLAAAALELALTAELAALFPEPVGHLIVQADLTAVAPGPLLPEVATDMRVLAEQESRGGGGVYRFSESSLRRAFDAGWSPEQIEQWLGEHSATGVPQPLRYLLADVARRHGSIRVTPTSTVIRCDDPSQAASLLARPESAVLGLTQLAPGVLIAQAEPDEVVRLLRQVGLAPVATDAQGATLTAPAAPRARETPLERTDREPTDVGAAAELLLNREQDRRERARAVDSAVDVLHRAAAAGATVVVDWVTAEGESTSGRATPLKISAGAVRLAEQPSGRPFTVPLARVVGARDED